MEITDEERKQAEKILRGLTWIGDKEEMIECIVKHRIRNKSKFY